MGKKLRIGVLMGGMSIEREVSFNSGRTICDHLDSITYDIIPLFMRKDGCIFILPWHFLHRGKITDFQDRLDTDAQKITWDELKNCVDFVYLALHGWKGEDGTIQGMLEVLSIPYLGSKVFGGALGMDKAMQKEFLRAEGISVPAGVVINPELLQTPDKCIEYVCSTMQKYAVSLPYIVKPAQEGSSLGITCVRSFDQLYPALYKAATVSPDRMQPVLVEEYITGMEFCSIILVSSDQTTYTALPATEISIEQGSDYYDYDQKYMPGRAHKITPARCSQEIHNRINQAAIAVAQALDIRTIARIDGFVTSAGEIVIIDPNTLSGMGPSSFVFRAAAEHGFSHTGLINHLIATELNAYGLSNIILHQDFTNMRPQLDSRIKVAVLLGGNSNEKEISLESGRNVVYKLSPTKYQTTPLFVSQSMELYELNNRQLVCNSTSEIAGLIDTSQKISWSDIPQLYDFVFIALHGGHGENGAIQGALETLGMPYNGSGVLSSALCMDKYRTTTYLQRKGLQVPHGVLVEGKAWNTNIMPTIGIIEDNLTYPVIVKPTDDGCSVMVSKVYTREQLEESLHQIFAHGKSLALVEEYIQGMELTVGVVGNRSAQALIPSYTVSTSDVLSIEEKFLPGAGENRTPAPLPAYTLEFVQREVERAFTSAGCTGYARIDCFYQNEQQSPTGQERLVILEINTLPGLTPATCIFHQAAELGIKPMDFIDLIVELGFERHKNKPLAPHFQQYLQVLHSAHTVNSTL